MSRFKPIKILKKNISLEFVPINTQNTVIMDTHVLDPYTKKHILATSRRGKEILEFSGTMLPEPKTYSVIIDEDLFDILKDDGYSICKCGKVFYNEHGFYNFDEESKDFKEEMWETEVYCTKNCIKK